MKPLRGAAATALLFTCALSGCSHAGTSSAIKQSGPPAQTGPSATTAAQANKDCTGGLTGNQPGVVRITCDGTATIHVQAGDTTKEFHGGACQSAGDIWSAAAGVILDETGAHGAYTGPPVDSVAINNTDAPGKGTIQLRLNGKHYYDLGEATLTLATGGTSAHAEGTSHQLSDAPGAKLTIDVTC